MGANPGLLHEVIRVIGRQTPRKRPKPGKFLLQGLDVGSRLCAHISSHADTLAIVSPRVKKIDRRRSAHCSTWLLGARFTLPSSFVPFKRTLEAI